MPGICGLPGCGQELDGLRADALFCSDAHKQAAYRDRRRPALGSVEMHWLCDECGTLYLGFPPYCPEHRQEGSMP